MDHQKQAVIIGAGPAGLTAAYELLKRTPILPVVLEKSECVGGICRTIDYKGNRIDIGGHRFFSKSDRVMEWWLRILPLQALEGAGLRAARDSKRVRPGPGRPLGPEKSDQVMLLRPRKSRIYYLRRFFDYPITLSRATVWKLGLLRTFRIGLSYLRSVLFPIKDEASLEQFLINRFGRELYRTFFKSYTEKVWGVPCTEISAEWGSQRTKGLSVRKTVAHAARKALWRFSPADIRQKDTETSLIEQFLYPKFGPGQMWEEAARQVREMGGSILTGHVMKRVITDGHRVRAVVATDLATGQDRTFQGDYVFSTAPVPDLLRAFDVPPPANVREVSEGLVYRDFVTVGLLVKQLKIHEDGPPGPEGTPPPVRDNWIYIQEPGVLVGRLQIYNNWSPFLVSDPSTVWLGLEYFCSQSDEIWNSPDERMIALAKEELSKIGIIEKADVLDATVIRMEKTYPAYFGAYARFAEIREYVDRFENLFLVGRNGMHRYNNQDHSMLTAMMAVDNILAGVTGKSSLWEVNTEQEYHEEAKNGTESGMA